MSRPKVRNQQACRLILLYFLKGSRDHTKGGGEHKKHCDHCTLKVSIGPSVFDKFGELFRNIWVGLLVSIEIVCYRVEQIIFQLPCRVTLLSFFKAACPCLIQKRHYSSRCLSQTIHQLLAFSSVSGHQQIEQGFLYQAHSLRY